MHQLDLTDTYGIFHSTIAESHSLKTCLQIGKRKFVLMIFKSQMKQKCSLKDIKYHSSLKKNISNLNPLKEVYYYFFNFTKKHQNHLNSLMNFRKTFRKEIIHILDTLLETTEETLPYIMRPTLPQHRNKQKYNPEQKLDNEYIIKSL